MIAHSIPPIGSWDHSGGCQACEHKGEVHRFVFTHNQHSNMGWTVRLCDKCLEEMHKVAFPGSYIRNW